jgi:type II secretion system protein N
MSRSKTIVLYAGVALTALAVFLYLRFPADMLKELISTQVSQSAPGVSIDIEKLSPNFPTGVTLTNIDLRYQNQNIFKADEATIAARLSTLVSDQKSIAYTFLTSGGTIKGRTTFRADDNGSGIDLFARFNSIQLKEIPAIKVFSGYDVAGILDGSASINGSDQNSSSQAVFNISECTLKLIQPLFGLEKLNFQLIEVELDMRGQRAIIKKCDLNGDEVDGRITGSLTVRKPYGQTRLNLSGVLKPQPDFSARLSKMIPVALLSGTNIQRKGIPFKITGTIDSPGYSLR